MNLENFNLVELDSHEVQEIEGGKLPSKRTINRILTAIGVYDAIDDFIAGWNSVDC
jgi:hypothetical protein